MIYSIHLKNVTKCKSYIFYIKEGRRIFSSHPAIFFCDMSINIHASVKLKKARQEAAKKKRVYLDSGRIAIQEIQTGNPESVLKKR